MTSTHESVASLPWRSLFAVRYPRLLAAASIATGAATILAGVGLITSSGYLVSRAGERPAILDLMVVFVTVRFFGLARPALRYAERLVSHDLTFRLLRGIRQWFTAALLPLSPGQLASFRAGDLLSRMAADVEILQEAWLRVIAPTVVALITAVVVVSSLLWVDVRLAFVVAALMLFSGVVWTWIAQRLAQGLGNAQNAHRRVLSAELVSLTQGLEDVLAFGYEGTALERICARQRELDAVEDQYGGRQALHGALATLLTNAAFAAALYITLAAADAGDLSPVWIAAISLGIVSSFEAIDSLPTAWQYAGRTLESAARIHDVVATRPAVVEAAVPLSLTCTSAPSVEFRDVTFGHEGRTVLEHVSVRIVPGEHVLVVGPTGAGKTSLLSLLTRAWDPSAGQVSVNGVDLRYLRTSDLRRLTAVMPQQVHVFNATLRENVRLANPDSSDDEIRWALTCAQLGPFHDSLADGLDTILGEYGARMSAGERQRLGFARLLLTDCPLVLVDEPTANLDVDTERLLLAELSAWAEGRTMILVSHRPIARAAVDRILVLGERRLTVLA